MTEYVVQKEMFGKYIEIAVIDVESSLAEGIINIAYAEGLRLQKIFNFYDPSSELSLLNTRKKISASKELLEVLNLALSFCAKTDGAYDISLGGLFLQRKKRLPELFVDYSYKDIGIQGSTITIKHPNLLIDLGSLAKGYIVDKVVAVLQSEGIAAGIVDGRGDIRVFGEQPVTMHIQHPRNPEKYIGTFKAQDIGVATSGDYNQYASDFNHSHIINKKETISATVIAPTLMLADVFATVLCVIDKKKRKELLDAYPSVKALLIRKDLNLSYHNGFEKAMIS